MAVIDRARMAVIGRAKMAVTVIATGRDYKCLVSRNTRIPFNRLNVVKRER